MKRQPTPFSSQAISFFFTLALLVGLVFTEPGNAQDLSDFQLDTERLNMTDLSDPNFPVPKIGWRELTFEIRPDASWSNINLSVRVADNDAFTGATTRFYPIASGNQRRSVEYLLTFDKPKRDATFLASSAPTERYAPGSTVFYQWRVSYTEGGESVFEQGDVHSFVVPRRVTVALMGDSFASGEGAPLLSGSPWQVRNEGSMARRSFRSGQELAVHQFFDGRPHLAWDYLNVSSSGAIASDVYSDESQFERTNGAGVSYPQWERVLEWLDLRNYSGLDAVVLSIGGNDMGFSTLITNYLGLNTNRIEQYAKDVYNDPNCSTLVSDALDLCEDIPFIGSFCEPVSTANRLVIAGNKVKDFVVSGIVDDYSFKSPYDAPSITGGTPRSFWWYENRLKEEYQKLGMVIDLAEVDGDSVSTGCVIVTEYPDVLKGCSSFFENLPILPLALGGKTIEISFPNPCAVAQCQFAYQPPPPITLTVPDVGYLNTGFSQTETTEARFDLGPSVLSGAKPIPGGLNHRIRSVVEDLDIGYPGTDWAFVTVSSAANGDTGLCFSNRHYNTITDALSKPGEKKVDNAYHPNLKGHKNVYAPRILIALENALTDQKLEERAAEDGLERPDALLPDLVLLPIRDVMPTAVENVWSFATTAVNRGLADSLATTLRLNVSDESGNIIASTLVPVPSLESGRGNGLSGTIQLPDLAIFDRLPVLCSDEDYPGFDYEAFSQRDRVLLHFWREQTMSFELVIDPDDSLIETNEFNNGTSTSVVRKQGPPEEPLASDVSTVLNDLSNVLNSAVSTLSREDFYNDERIRNFFGYYLAEEKNSGADLRQHIVDLQGWKVRACAAQALNEALPIRPEFDPGLCDGFRPACRQDTIGTVTLAKDASWGRVLDELGRAREVDLYISELIENVRNAVLVVELEQQFADLFGSPTLEILFENPVSLPGLQDLAFGQTLPTEPVLFRPEENGGEVAQRILIGNSPQSGDLYQGLLLPTGAGDVGEFLLEQFPQDGRVIYATLESEQDGEFVRSVTPLRTPARNARLLSPVEGELVEMEGVVLQWGPPSEEVAGNVQAYSLSVGSEPGLADIFPGPDSDGFPFEPSQLGSGISAMELPNLPSDGRPLHITLGTLRDDTWGFERYVREPAESTRVGLELPQQPRPFTSFERLRIFPGNPEDQMVSVSIGTRPGAADLFAVQQFPIEQAVRGLPVQINDLPMASPEEGRGNLIWITVESASGQSIYPRTVATHGHLVSPNPWESVEDEQLDLVWAQAENVESYFLVVYDQNGQRVYTEEFEASDNSAEVDFPDGSEFAIVHLFTVSEEGEGLANAMDVTVYYRPEQQSNLYVDDGIPDYWQQLNFGNGNAQAVPLADPDFDGQNNLFEFLAGTNPRDANQFFRPMLLRGANDEAIRFEVPFPSAATEYLIQGSSTMANGTWMNVGGATNGAVPDAENTLRMPIPEADGGFEFYRLRLRPFVEVE